MQIAYFQAAVPGMKAVALWRHTGLFSMVLIDQTFTEGRPVASLALSSMCGLFLLQLPV